MAKSLAHETASFGGSLLSRSWNSIRNTAHSGITGVKKGIGGIVKNTKGLLLAGGVLLFPYTALGAGSVYATAKTAKGLFHVFKGEGTKGWEEIKSGVTDPLTFVRKEGGAKVIDAGVGLGKGATTIIAAPFAAVGDALGTNENINSQNLRSRSNGSSTTAIASETPIGQAYGPEPTEKPESNSTNHNNDKKRDNGPTPIPVPIPTGGSDNSEREANKAQEKLEREQKEAQEKADKEAKDAEKKAEKEKKKEEEKSAKEEIVKTVDELNKQQKTFGNKIDGAIKKVNEVSIAESIREKEEKYQTQIDHIRNNIITNIDTEKRKTLSTNAAIGMDQITAINRDIDPTTDADLYNYIKEYTIATIPILENIETDDDVESLNKSRTNKRTGYGYSKWDDGLDLLQEIKGITEGGSVLSSDYIKWFKAYVGHKTGNGVIQESLRADISSLMKKKKDSIQTKPEHIEKQQEKLVDALNKMKTESAKAVSSIASSSRLGGKKLNKDNAGDALEQLSEAMSTVTEQANAGEKRIDMTKPIAGITESYQSLLDSIQSLTS